MRKSMRKSGKQKVIDFLTALDDNRLVSKVSKPAEQLITREPARNTTMTYKGQTVLCIDEYGDNCGRHDGAMVIARDGREHFLEETLTPRNLKHFEVFKKFTFK